MAAVNNRLNSLKVMLFSEIRRTNAEFAVNTDDEMNLLFFHRPDQLRLSLTGFHLVRKIFTAYSFPIPESIKTRHRVGMSKLEFPYFFSNKRLILFSELDASMVTLSGGVIPFLESCSQIDQ